MVITEGRRGLVPGLRFQRAYYRAICGSIEPDIFAHRARSGVQIPCGPLSRARRREPSADIRLFEQCRRRKWSLVGPLRVLATLVRSLHEGSPMPKLEIRNGIPVPPLLSWMKVRIASERHPFYEGVWRAVLAEIHVILGKIDPRA